MTVNTTMAVTVLLLVVSLLDPAEGSEKKFVKCKTDLLLDKGPKTVFIDDDFLWKFNENVNLVKFNSGVEPKISDIYKDRVEFFKQNYSLLIKNVQHEDSGVYKAIVSGNTDIPLAEYDIIIQDPVSPVKITMDSSDVNNCNATVTCRTNDSKITRTFQCDNKACSPVTNSIVTAPYSQLTVYVEHYKIICNHSNNVSSEQDEINFRCGTTSAPSSATIAGISAGLLCGLAAVTLGTILLRRNWKRKGVENTLYEVPQNVNTNPNSSPVRDALDDSPTSTYALVQLPTRPAPKEENGNKALPETVYAQIMRAPKPSSAAPTEK